MNKYLLHNEADFEQDLCRFMDASPVNFWAVESVRQRLEAEGFSELHLTDEWHLSPGQRRYVRQNGTAIFAFIVGDGGPAKGFNIVAAHSDSPGFRIKPNAIMPCEGGMYKLNTEVYGGPILYTWFDRPLSMAGRVLIRTADPLHPRAALCNVDKYPCMVIPHLAIHFNRAVNEGNKLSRQKDMLPLMPLSGAEDFMHIVRANTEGITDDDEIIDFDLSLYNYAKAAVVGVDNRLIISGRLDDLSMVYAGLTALLQQADTASQHTRVLAVFDNEETGSGTKQGAASPILEHILRRLTYACGGSDNDFIRAVAASFLISADNGHAVHPNYTEKHDPTNHPVLGGGPCIKVNANCKYMTDADTAAVFAELCRRANVPCQYFVNHSDSAGGSTLGNILTSQMPMRGVDMGAPILAMHSAAETAAIGDILYSAKAFATFFAL